MFTRRLALPLLASLLALGAYSATAQAQSSVRPCSGPTQLPAETEVIFYEHTQYGGQCWVVDVTASYWEPWVGNLGITNDAISSLKVGARIALVLYENVDHHTTMVGYASDPLSIVFVPYVGDAVNDKTSSFTMLLRQ